MLAQIVPALDLALAYVAGDRVTARWALMAGKNSKACHFASSQFSAQCSKFSSGSIDMSIQRQQIYQLKVTLQGSRPAIWRRLLVSSDTTLERLHHVIQVAMGWDGYHMHLFTTDKGRIYGALESDQDDMLSLKDETEAKLSKLLRKPKKKLLYEYDLGDGWMHEVVLEKQLPLIGSQVYSQTGPFWSASCYRGGLFLDRLYCVRRCPKNRLPFSRHCRAGCRRQAVPHAPHFNQHRPMAA